MADSGRQRCIVAVEEQQTPPHVGDAYASAMADRSVALEAVVGAAGHYAVARDDADFDFISIAYRIFFRTSTSIFFVKSNKAFSRAI